MWFSKLERRRLKVDKIKVAKILNGQENIDIIFFSLMKVEIEDIK